MISCTRILTWEAGHRVHGHENKCANLHGHSYRAEITARFAPEPIEKAIFKPDVLDEIGRVIDFSVLKERVGGWIDDNWDHAFIYWHKDGAVLAALTHPAVPVWKAFQMPSNPTAENIAKYLLDEVCTRQLAGTGVLVTHVRVWETANCYADASL